MNTKSAIVVAVLFLSACAVTIDNDTPALCDSDAASVVAGMVAAHGGMEPWLELASLYVEREHLFAGTEQPIRFNIHGEYPSHRIVQEWQAPPGVLAWDGERAWSSDWVLADRLMPRYVAGIGFYLVNMPWLAQQDATRLEAKGCTGRLPGHGERDFLIVVAHYEPEPVRKPDWFDGPRDHFELYIDPDSNRLAGVMQHWTYAARLDSAGLPATENTISQLFVPESYVEVKGLVWPYTYKAYSPTGEVAAEGRFFGYDFSRRFDEGRLFPGAASSFTPDLSSSYRRNP